MKTLLILLTTLLTINSWATVDVQSQVTIVAEDWNELNGLGLRTVPAEFCVGIEPLAMLQAITQPVWINAYYGCGTSPSQIQINKATCAVVSGNEVPNPDGSYNPYTISVDIDLSACIGQQYGADFEKTLIEAIYTTFANTSYQITKITKK